MGVDHAPFTVAIAGASLPEDDGKRNADATGRAISETESGSVNALIVCDGVSSSPRGADADDMTLLPPFWERVAMSLNRVRCASSTPEQAVLGVSNFEQNQRSTRARSCRSPLVLQLLTLTRWRPDGVAASQTTGDWRNMEN